jgi:hypothetical protein
MASVPRHGALLVLALSLASTDLASVEAHEKDAAHALLERWLAAQNDGQFADYEKLYAPDFSGLRTSGKRSVRLDRAGWMADRHRMFQKKMTVSADDVRMRETHGNIWIQFTQKWSSGRYSDVGPKQMFLTRGPNGLLITWEGLMSSALMPSAPVLDTGRASPSDPQLDPRGLLRFALLVDGELLVREEPNERWGVGEPRHEVRPGQDADLTLTGKAVDANALPAQIKALKGGAVHLMDARGPRCDARIASFVLRGRRVFNSSDDVDETWELSHHNLVAKLDGITKACDGATWARSAELPAPMTVPGSAASEELAKLATAAFVELPQAQAIQRKVDAAYRGKRVKPGMPWFQRKGASISMRAISEPPAGAVLVSVTASHCTPSTDDDEYGSCYSLWGLWRVQDSGGEMRLDLVNKPDEGTALFPTGAIRLDRDDGVQLLFDGQEYASVNGANVEHGVVRAVGGRYVDIVGPSTAVGCPL